METTVTARVPAREADWRFLLPRAEGGAFNHLLLLGGSAGLGAAVADRGIARHVSRSVGDAPADVFVVLADADVDIESLLPAIAEAAFVYIEIDRRLPGRRTLTPRRLTRTLARHGLDMATTYWVKPGFPRRDMYLPFGHRGALRWYLKSIFRATSPGRRLLKAAMERFAGRAFAAVAPCYAITAVRGRARVLPAVLEDTCAGRETIEPVLLASGQADWSRLVFMLFDGDTDRPTAVVKLPRMAGLNYAVEQEHAVLREVSAMLPPALLPSIPSSTFARIDGLAVTTETCARGTSVATRSGPGADGSLRDLRCAAAWLTSFHRETTRGHADSREWVAQELLARVCAEYAARFGRTAAESRLFDAALHSVDAATGDLPIVWQHADFGPWNIYRDGDDVSVIDWEVARRGPALADLLYFVLHWSAAVRGCQSAHDRVRHFESLFCGTMPTDPIGRAVYGELLDYMRAVDVPARLFPHILLYTVAEQAIDRARRLEQMGQPASRDAAANEYVGEMDVLARHARPLFHGARTREVLRAAS